MMAILDFGYAQPNDFGLKVFTKSTMKLPTRFMRGQFHKILVFC